jgi:hypothetical protein
MRPLAAGAPAPRVARLRGAPPAPSWRAAASARCVHGALAPPASPLAPRAGQRRLPPAATARRAPRAAPRRGPAPAAAGAAAPADAAPWEADWEAMGPAFAATLDLLEWPAFCEHVASFASTAVGKRLCRELEVPLDQATSERLLAETR